MFEIAGTVGPLVIASLVVLSPFIAIPLLLGYVVGRRVDDPVGAGVASGIVGVTLFWSSLIIAMILAVDDGQGAGFAFMLSVFLVVAIAVSPIFLALAVFTWWRTRRRVGLR